MTYTPICHLCGEQHAPDVICRPKVAEWIVRTCLMFGAMPSTAYQVAGLFLKQLEEDEANPLDSRTKGE